MEQISTHVRGHGMVTCSVCGETIGEKSLDGIGVQCTACGTRYCGRCSITIFNCLKCGKRTEEFKKEPLEDYSEPSISMVNMRRHSREQHRTIVEYLLAPPPNTNEAWKKVTALSRDISESGICIYTKMRHKEGQTLHFVVNGKRTKGRVCWVKKIDDTTYTAGIMFEENP